MKNIFLFIRRYFIFLSFLVLQIICIVTLSTYSRTHEAFFSTAANEVTGRINSQYSGVSTYFNLKETNRQLAEENARLRNMLAQNFQAPDSSVTQSTDSSYRDSTTRYRKFTYLPARVVGNSVSLPANYLTLERGSKQGVEKGMAVTGPQGIVGVVVAVSDNYAKVMSLLNRNSKVSSMLKKDNVTGSVEWDGNDPSYLTLKGIPRSAKVVKGDTVLTSNYSANYPSHLMVGTVAAVNSDPATNFYTIKVKTATNFFSIQYVTIIANKLYNEQTELENQQLRNQ